MDMKRKALEDIRGWASKGAARDAGKRHGVTLPEDSDFPEPMEAMPEEESAPEGLPEMEALGEEATPEAAAPIGAEGLDGDTLQALLGLLAEEG